MSSDWDIIGREGLQFFGKISASFSHEIKNILAIINENAGLLEDFLLMAEKGRPIDMERFKTVAGKIRNQVRRADGIVKNLNRFAHGADDFKGEIDLNDVLNFVVALSSRLADMQGVTLEQAPLERSLMITTIPFFLQNLLWRCLNFAMETAGDEKKVHLLVEKMESGARITFSHLKGIENTPEDRFPSLKEKALSNALGARISLNDVEEELILLFPDDVEH